jgi:hypothetical protein
MALSAPQAWRYQRTVAARWDSDFRRITRARHVELDVPFEQIEEHLGPFFESVEIRVVNSFTGDVLDYERTRGLRRSLSVVTSFPGLNPRRSHCELFHSAECNV